MMLRRKDAPYRGGDLLKLKSFADAEATIISHIPSKGKFLGMLGSLEVGNTGGVRFRVGSGFTVAQRKNPPPVGARITYKHNGFTNTANPASPSSSACGTTSRGRIKV